MFIALDSNGKRIDVADAEKGNDYFCPICQKNLILKNGTKKVKHFSHRSINCDTFSHDMTDWHKTWQEQFPFENRECVLELDGEKHRADVLWGGYVFEFQNSPITSAEFEQRNAFYTKAGKKVVWIFNFIESFQKDHFVCIDEFSNGREWRWKYNRGYFSTFVPQKRKENILLFFQFHEGNFSNKHDSFPYLNRVTWTRETQPFATFQTSTIPTDLQSLLSWLEKQ